MTSIAALATLSVVAAFPTAAPAQRCDAAPGTAAVDQYCESVPGERPRAAGGGGEAPRRSPLGAEDERRLRQAPGGVALSEGLPETPEGAATGGAGNGGSGGSGPDGGAGPGDTGAGGSGAGAGDGTPGAAREPEPQVATPGSLPSAGTLWSLPAGAALIVGAAVAAAFALGSRRRRRVGA